MVLFVYCLGFGICILNTSFPEVQAFCWGSILQRVSVLWMLASFAHCIERARYFCGVLAIITTIATVCFLLVALYGHNIQESPLIMTAFWMGTATEFFGEMFLMKLTEGRRLLPINIEQSKERLGALELIMLGETVLSVCIIYREFHSSTKDAQAYYWILGFSFLLIFMFLLFFFHMQPSPEDHAARRSRHHGVALYLLHKTLALTFLAVGTSVKVVVNCYLNEEPSLPRFGTSLFGYSVGCSILCMVGMRYLHYGGKDTLNFGHRVFQLGQNQRLDLMVKFWWRTVGIAAILPMVGLWTGFTFRHNSPLALVAAYATLLFVLCAVESYYSHQIQDCLMTDGVGLGDLREEEEGKEGDTLLTASSTNRMYNS
jgi:hypothetical protein